MGTIAAQKVGPPLIGPYYWVPQPSVAGVTWRVLTCHDVGLPDETGHFELWPFVLEQLAQAWGRDARALKRRLGLYYTGLSRGRITRPEKVFLLLHGDDSPVPGPAWKDLVIERFQMPRGRVKLLFDHHETMIAGHPEAFNAIFDLGTKETPC